MEVGYGSAGYPAEVSVSASFVLNSRLPPALRNKDLERTHSSLAPVLRAALIPSKHCNNILFSVDEVKALREMVWARGAYENAEEHRAQGQNESKWWGTAASIHQKELGAASFAMRAAEVLHRGYNILPGFGTFAACPGDVLNLLDCPIALPDGTLGEFSEFMHSTFEGEEFLKDEASRRLLNPIINAGDEEHDRNEQDAGSSRFTSIRELVVEYLQSDGERMWAARSRAAMDVWLGWIAAVVNLDDNRKSPCSLLNTRGRLLLMGREAEAQKEHNDFVPRAVESPGFFLVVTDKEERHLYVTSVSHLYMHYNVSKKQLMKDAFTMEKTEVPPSSVYIGHGYVQHAGAEWRGQHCIWYHLYLVPRNHDLADAIDFGYGGSIAIRSGADAILLEGERGPQRGGSEEEENSKEGSQMDAESESSYEGVRNESKNEAGIPEGSEYVIGGWERS